MPSHSHTQLLESLATAAHARLEGDHFTVRRGGLELRARVVQRGKTTDLWVIAAADPEEASSAGAATYRPPAARADEPRAGVKTLPFEAVQLRLEGRLDRLGKRLWINRELQLDDPTFDELVYIDTDVPDDRVKALLAPPAVRTLAVELLSAGCEALYLTGDCQVAATTTPQQPARVPHAQVPRLMSELALSPPVVRFPPGPRSTSRAERLTLVTILVAILSPIVGLLGLTLSSGHWPALDSSLGFLGALFGLLAWLPFVGVFALLVRGRSSSFRLVVAIGAFAAAGLPLVCAALGYALNGELDRSVPVRHRALVIAVHKPSKGSPSARVSSWRRRGESEEVKLSQGTSVWLRPGASLTVITRKGAFGFEWVEGVVVDLER